LRSIADTDVREVSPLLTTSFFVHLGFFGLMPALLVVFAPITRLGWRRDLALRGGLAALSLAVSAGVLYWNYGPLSFFIRQNHQLRLLINPDYALYSAIQYLVRSGEEASVERIPLDAHVDDALGTLGEKPTLVVLVLGETARSDRFSLNGYARDTNRYTPALGVRNLGSVVACGTSTADSLPCLFSQFGRADFDQAKAMRHENLFGVLARLGVNVAWLDNSTGCKNICDSAHFEEFAGRQDPDLCDSTGCFDEILLDGLDRAIGDTSRDQFIVMHQRGSHGPAYYTDVPAWAKFFQPECDLPNLRNCNRDAIDNSYDNTILYTDFFLARVIEFLAARTGDFATAMIYVSDHGESLGENGLYLHGFPYALAPREQTQVPMLLWTDGTFSARHHVNTECVPTANDAPLSHDFVFHTVLAIFGVASPVYRPDLDLLAACRQNPGPKNEA
jgi:lipid A ethanolaminephosphotransferase